MTTARTRIAVDTARELTADQLSAKQRGGRASGAIFQALLLFCILVALVMLAAVLITSFIDGLPRFSLDSFTNMPNVIDPNESGFQSAIVGTLMIMGGLIVTVLPLGISAAIYLEEFADKDKWYIRLIEINIQNLAAVPSIVFGILGLAFIYRGPELFGVKLWEGLGPVAYAGSLTLALLVLPTIILASREAIRAVPPSIRDASMGLGATKWRTIWHQVLPSSIPGIATGTILALSRAIGETAPLLMVGAATFVRSNPDSPFEGSYTALPVQIFQYFGRPQEEYRILAAAGIIVMMVVLLSMNSIAIWIRNRYARSY